MHDANVLTTAGYISGEIKLAVTIRLLAGGDGMDLAVILYIYPSHINTILYKVLLHWIIKLNIGKMDIMKYVGDKEAMKRVSDGFSRQSNGGLKGDIGAINGWLVNIQRPTFWYDSLTNPVSFYSRNGYYVLNVK